LTTFTVNLIRSVLSGVENLTVPFPTSLVIHPLRYSILKKTRTVEMKTKGMLATKRMIAVSSRQAFLTSLIEEKW
jgi:hypothetical protein